MDAGPDGVRPSAVEEQPFLGAVPADHAQLGPISPELALVDPELAERARQLLPEPRGRPRSRPRLEPQAVPLPEAAAPSRRRWPRTVALAALIFAAGAASGGFFGERHGSAPETTLGAQLIGPEPSASTDGGKEATRREPTTTPPAFRPPTVSSAHASKRAHAKTARRRARPVTDVTWAANVLGVAARVDGPGVELAWQRPAGSSHVVVLRTVGAGKRSSVVFRGRAKSYRDVSARPCTAYRYTIVNYDRRGRRSPACPRRS